MKLPNWFRIVWWLILCAAVSALLIRRMPDMASGRSNAADLVFFWLWLLLVLVPIFTEIKLGSLVHVKQAIEDARDDVKRSVRNEIADLRIEMRNAVDVRTNISPQFNFPTPPSDDQLPNLERIIREVLTETLEARQPPPARDPRTLAVTDDVRLLFETRYRMEVELRRIAEESDLLGTRPVAGLRLADRMSRAGILPLRLFEALREVYAVCSPGIHGAQVTNAQVDFVREVGPELISVLESYPRDLPARTATL